MVSNKTGFNQSSELLKIIEIISELSSPCVTP